MTYSRVRSASWIVLVAAQVFVACGGEDVPENTVDAGASAADASTPPLIDAAIDAGDVYTLPPPPTGVGAEITVEPPANVPAYVDEGATNARNDACHVTVETNAGVRVLRRFMDVWMPSSLLVNAGVTLPANGDCPAVTPASWTGIPGDDTDGMVLDATVHAANIAYVEHATQARTPAQELAAYLDDRRQKGYSVTDGMGPLTGAWREGTRQTTSIVDIPADAATVKYDDTGNNLGLGSASNPDLGLAVDFIGAMSADGSTEPAKRFFKYARPWRWSSQVVVAPSLLPARSGTPATDGGFLSGHAAEGWRDALAMAYLVPERFQELIARACELGDNRILAGMHSPLDVMGGRIQATAIIAYNLSKGPNRSLATSALAQAQSYLMTRAGASTAGELDAFAHTGGASDRFHDRAANRAAVGACLTYGFVRAAAADLAPLVPRGAEVLLETRLPYLSPAQRRAVLASTELPSGYPLLDDDEGWGRLDLFAAADGYGSFQGDVDLELDAAQDGFSALDRWRNDISGPGMLRKRGSGALRLSGANSYTGGTLLLGGTLAADSTVAFGLGDVYVAAGTLESAAPGALLIGRRLTLLPGSTLGVAMASAGQGTLLVTGGAFVDGATLRVTFPGAYRPAPGDTLWIVVAGELHGRFAGVSVDGFGQIVPVYDHGALRVQLVAR